MQRLQYLSQTLKFIEEFDTILKLILKKYLFWNDSSFIYKGAWELMTNIHGLSRLIRILIYHVYPFTDFRKEFLDIKVIIFALYSKPPHKGIY